MEGELFRKCEKCGESRKHMYKFIGDRVFFFCTECGSLDIKMIPIELLEGE